MAESEEELKSHLMKVKEESENVGLKLNIQKMKIMASRPITSWEIDGETVETVADFIFWGSKITVDGDCSHEIKKCLLLGKVMTNLDSIFKGRDINYLANKGSFSQGYDFSSSHVWMWDLDYKESWAPKNWCFWTVVLLLRVKEESEKASLKLNIQKMKIMASRPITPWQIDEETTATVKDFIFLASKITAATWLQPRN